MPRYEVYRVGEADNMIAAFSTAADAAAYVKEAQAANPQKYRIHFECSDFEVYKAKDREHYRMRGEDGDTVYIPLPSWFPRVEYPFNHFAHCAVDEERRKQGWVAYTPDVRHLIEDKQLTLPASKYLAKFFSKEYSPEEIAKLHLRLQGSFDPTTFAITQDRAILHKAFIGTKHCAESSDYESCMRYDHDEYRLPAGQHPVDAYFFDDPAQSSFALAYTMRGDDIVARAMVVPSKKIFVRVYGDSEIDRHDILNHLKAAGHKRAKSYEGARLCLRPHPKSSRGLPIMPYVDGSIQTCDADGYITSEDWAYDCETTEGFGRPRDDEDAYFDEDYGTFYCERTEQEYSERDYSRVDIFIPNPYSNNLRNGTYVTWCNSATEGLRAYCPAADRGWGAWVPVDDPNYLVWLAQQREAEAKAATPIQLTPGATWEIAF